MYLIFVARMFWLCVFRRDSIKVGVSEPGKTYVWREQGYTSCSASCLGGVEELIINCVREDTGKIGKVKESIFIVIYFFVHLLVLFYTYLKGLRKFSLFFFHFSFFFSAANQIFSVSSLNHSIRFAVQSFTIFMHPRNKA